MRVLVAIANHGHGNRQHLDRLVREYQSMRKYQVRIVVVSNIPKDLGPGVEVRVGVPAKNPWSLPFAHRPLFAELADEYDLFIYGEDDTLVRENNIDAFVDATRVLHEDELAGFIRSEQDKEGRRYVSSIHSHHHWHPESAVRRGDQTFARLTNDHGAVYMLTRDQLKRAIASGGFLVPPHEGPYDMLVAAATDPYTQCGFKRLVSLTRIEDFILPHLPNKYVGKMGVPREEVQRQVEALIEIGRGQRPAQRLYEPAPFVSDGHFERHYYEWRRDDVLSLIPAGAKSILSVGAGWGQTEAALKERGADVTLIPLDSVVVESARLRGLRVLPADLDEALAQVPEGSVDCALFCDVLHHFGDPSAVLVKCAKALKPGGKIVISEPNAEAIRMRKVGLVPMSNGHGGLNGAAGARALLRPRRADVRRWLGRAGLRTERVTAPPATARTPMRRRAQRLLGRWLSRKFLVVAVKDQA